VIVKKIITIILPKINTLFKVQKNPKKLNKIILLIAIKIHKSILTIMKIIKKVLIILIKIIIL
jgi:hypothetical protein